MNEKDIVRFKGLLERIRQNPLEKLSKEDLDFFTQAMPTVDESAMTKLSVDSSPEEVAAALQAAATALVSSPEHRDKLMTLYNTKQAGKIAGTVRGVLNTVLAAGDIGASQRQINESRQAMRNLRRPQRPLPLAAEPALKQAMNSAQAGTFDAARRIAPAQQALLDNYLSDINNVRTASTGQAGNFGAGAQVASLRRSRGSMGLAPIMDDIRAREQSRYDQLLGLKLGENQAIQQSAAQYYPTELQGYYNELGSAAQLGGTGRENLRAGYANLASGIPDAIAQAALNKRMRAYRQMGIQGGPEAQQAYVAAESGLNEPPRRRVGGYTIPTDYNYEF